MEPDHDQPAAPPTRRSVLRGGAAAGVTLPLLTACGSQSFQTQPAKSGARVHGPLVSASKVPVGGGEILADKQIVVTQPEEGDFKAFSAVCTHMQCLVTAVQNGVIICPCHGSEFSVRDGSVVRGPAATPLPSVRVHVAHGEVLPG